MPGLRPESGLRRRLVRSVLGKAPSRRAHDAGTRRRADERGRRALGGLILWRWSPAWLVLVVRAAADELAAALASWCIQAGEHIGVEAPRPSGLWWSAPGRKIDSETGEAYLVEAEPVGIRSASALTELVRWIDPLLDRVAAAPWAPEMLADLARLDAGARARWAVEEPERRVRDIACPSCNAYSLVVTPVRVVGGQEQVTCSRISCGRVLSSQDWERLRAWSVLVARMSAKAEEPSA